MDDDPRGVESVPGKEQVRLEHLHESEVGVPVERENRFGGRRDRHNAEVCVLRQCRQRGESALDCDALRGGDHGLFAKPRSSLFGLRWFIAAMLRNPAMFEHVHRFIGEPALGFRGPELCVGMVEPSTFARSSGVEP